MSFAPAFDAPNRIGRFLWKEWLQLRKLGAAYDQGTDLPVLIRKWCRRRTIMPLPQERAVCTKKDNSADVAIKENSRVRPSDLFFFRWLRLRQILLERCPDQTAFVPGYSHSRLRPATLEPLLQSSVSPRQQIMFS